MEKETDKLTEIAYSIYEIAVDCNCGDNFRVIKFMDNVVKLLERNNMYPTELSKLDNF